MLDDAAIGRLEEEWRQTLKRCGVDDPHGYELLFSLQVPAHLLEVIAERYLQASGLSVPRLGLLIWLYVGEQLGNAQGISPSRLSQFQHISRNTVSSLLQSLEEQGLIERELRSEDKRRFNIRLSPAGRALVCSILPQQGALLTDLFSALSAEEQATLLVLLSKLGRSLLKRAHPGLVSAEL